MAQHRFELANLLRERRLREVEAHGRAAEVQLFGDRDKVPEVAELDLWIHIWEVWITRNRILDILPVARESGVEGDDL